MCARLKQVIFSVLGVVDCRVIVHSDFGGSHMNIEINGEAKNKKNYHAPELIELGAVSAVVQMNAGPGPDGGNGVCISVSHS